MTTVTADMTISLDGFIVGANDSPENPGGDGAIQLHVLPVLFGESVRLFDRIGATETQLEPLRVIERSAATHLKYRILKEIRLTWNIAKKPPRAVSRKLGKKRAR